LNLAGYSATTPTKSSQIASTYFTLIHTTTGITGDFTTVNEAEASSVDYLTTEGEKSANNLDYNVGYGLTWTSGPVTGNGTFTLASGSSFELDDTALNNEAASATGWNGQDLTESGAGTLILDQINGYTGTTEIDGGTLELNQSGSIEASSSATINNGTLDISHIAGTSTTIQNLSGTTDGNITLSGKNLTINQSQDLTYEGNFDASNGSITKNGTGELVLSGQTNYTGNTTINQGTLTLDGTNGGAQLVSNVIGTPGATLNITNRATLTGTIDPLDVNITNGSVWNVTGNSQVLALTSNSGNINFIAPPTNSTNPADYKTLAATSLNGGNGSAITMNTNLAANIGDRIDTQTTSGSSAIMINNTGGTISGTPLALEIINVADSTASTGTFTLSNAGGTVDVGVYKYQLVQGNTSNNLQDIGSWYLAVLENGGSGSGGTTPELSNQVKSIVAASDQASRWLMTSDSLLQRMGELRTTGYDQAKYGFQSWVRGYGWQANVNTSNSQVGYKESTYGFDLGTDKAFNTTIGEIYTGLMIGYANSRRDVNGEAGQTTTDTIYGGIYGTWMNDKGYYADAVVKIGHLQNNIKTYDQQNSEGDYGNWGISGSLEAGKQFKTETGWYVEPQIQGTYMYFTKADLTTSGDSLEVDQRASSSYDIRTGVVAGKSITTQKAGIFQPYIRGMYGQTWTDGGDININGENFKGNSAGNRLEVGGGIAWQLTQNSELHADYEYINGPRMEVPWKFDVGFRYNW